MHIKIKHFLSQRSPPIFTLLLLLCSSVANTKEKILLTAFESCPYVCTGGNERGFLIDIVDSIFDKSEIEPEITVVPFKRALRNVKEGLADGIIGISHQQAPELVFPDEHIGQFRHEMYVKHDSNWTYTGLRSLKPHRIGARLGEAYGIFDSYIRRNSKKIERIHFISGKAEAETLVKLLNANRISMFLEDKNTIDRLYAENSEIIIKKAGSLPPNNIFVAFNHRYADRYANEITKGLNNLRNSGKLEIILNRYGLNDWKEWGTEYQDPFSGNYLEKLKRLYPQPQTKTIDNATISFEASVSKDSGYWKYASKFKELLEGYSDGRFKVNLKFGTFTEHDIVMNIAEGTSQMGMVATNNFSPYAPSIGVLSLPYMIPSIDDAKGLFRHKIMEEIADRSAMESGVRPISFFIGGYRLLANNVRIVKKTSDLKGLKIRVPQNQIMVESFRSWGVDPYPISWPQVYPYIEEGIVHGQENPINIMFSGINMKQDVWESLKYVTNIRYFMFTAPHLISDSFYKSLTMEDRGLLERSAKEAEDFIWSTVEAEDKKLTELAISKGMIFVEPDNEQEDWTPKAKTIWPMLYFRVGGKDLVNKVQQAIEKR